MSVHKWLWVWWGWDRWGWVCGVGGWRLSIGLWDCCRPSVACTLCRNGMLLAISRLRLCSRKAEPVLIQHTGAVCDLGVMLTCCVCGGTVLQAQHTGSGRRCEAAACI